MRYQRKNHTAFTLIELITIIVILGTITAIALPTFIDFSADARIQNVRTFEKNMKSMAEVLRLKRITAGTNTLTFEGSTMNFRNEYPVNRTAQTSGSLFFLEFLGYSQSEVPQNARSTRNGASQGIWIYERNDTSRMGYGSGDLIRGQCYAEYQNKTDGTLTFSNVTSGC